MFRGVENSRLPSRKAPSKYLNKRTNLAVRQLELGPGSGFGLRSGLGFKKFDFKGIGL